MLMNGNGNYLRMKTVGNVKLVDSRVVGTALGIQPRVVHELFLKGLIPGYKITRRALRFDLREVLRVLKSRSEDE
jgi:hypothetical protein